MGFFFSGSSITECSVEQTLPEGGGLDDINDTDLAKVVFELEQINSGDDRKDGKFKGESFIQA